MKTEDHENDDTNNIIPTVEIEDPYDYVSTNKIIANIIINGKQGRERRPLIRTKKGGYMMQ